MKRIAIALSVSAICLTLLGRTAELYAAQKGHPGKITLLQDNKYVDALISGIRNAKKEITGCFFLFKINNGKGSLPLRVAEELADAKKRGVDVAIELEQEATGIGTVYEQNRRAARFLADAGIKVRFDAPKTTTHIKALVIDRRYVFLGSHNLTQSALKYNNELSVLIDSPELAGEISAYLNGL